MSLRGGKRDVPSEAHVLELKPKEYDKVHQQGFLRTFAEIAPLSMLVMSPYDMLEFGKFITQPGNPKGCCAEKGSEQIRETFKKELAERGLRGRMRANAAGCLDQCAFGPTVVVYPEQVWYTVPTPADAEEIIEKHLIGGVPVERLLMRTGKDKKEDK